MPRAPLDDRSPAPRSRWRAARLGGCAAMLAALAAPACSRAEPRTVTPAPKLPEPKARARRPASPPEWYWEAVDPESPSSSGARLALPLPERALRRVEGGVRLWDELPAGARERVLRDGAVVLGSDVGVLTTDERRARSFGAFYTYLRDQRIPHVVTLDALFSIAHLGLVHALAELEETELGPALELFLARVEARLGAEQAGAPAELADAYRVARGLVAVARALASAGYTPPRDLGAVVTAERQLVEAATGVATSPLLRVPVDYARLAPPATAARPGAFRALAWLGRAPLVLSARTEVAGATAGTAQARTSARAAMLLARVCDEDVDGAIHAAYARIQRLLAFVWGPSDDLSLSTLADVADAAKVDITNPRDVSNVVRVDRVRARARAGRAPALHDGTAGPSVRVFGGHAPTDSIALKALAGARRPPSALDVAVWLGAPEARTIAREVLGDEDHDAALERVVASKRALDDGVLHASVHGSYLDALIAWANAPPPWGIEPSLPVERMRVESLLSAWSLARHTSQPMARARRDARPPAELRVSGQPLPVFVEPRPEVISRLVSFVRQLRRGLTSTGFLATPSPATASLLELEDVLRVALAAAQRDGAGGSSSDEERAALAALPARIGRLEDGAGEDALGAPAVFFVDRQGRRTITTAAAGIEPVLLFARAADADQPLLVVGAHVAHRERMAPEGEAAEREAERAPWVSSFRWTR